MKVCRKCNATYGDEIRFCTNCGIPLEAAGVQQQSGGGMNYPVPVQTYARNGYYQNGYGQGGYAQNGYAQNGYAQNGYAQNGYGQGGYAQNGYAQNGYAQSGYAQNGYAQGGYAQGGGRPNDQHGQRQKVYRGSVEGVGTNSTYNDKTAASALGGLTAATVIWLIIGIMQIFIGILTLVFGYGFGVLFCAGWNIVNSARQFGFIKKMKKHEMSIVSYADANFTIAVIFIFINLIFGGLIGVVASVADVIALNNIRSHRNELY